MRLLAHLLERVFKRFFWYVNIGASIAASTRARLIARQLACVPNQRVYWRVNWRASTRASSLVRVLELQLARIIPRLQAHILA